MPLQTPVVPAIIKSTLAALINDSFYHTHLIMPKTPQKFGRRHLGAAGGARGAGNPAEGFDSKASALAAITQILSTKTSAEKPPGSCLAPGTVNYGCFSLRSTQNTAGGDGRGDTSLLPPSLL